MSYERTTATAGASVKAVMAIVIATTARKQTRQGCDPHGKQAGPEINRKEKDPWRDCAAASTR
jgi:hypothetical protein